MSGAPQSSIARIFRTFEVPFLAHTSGGLHRNHHAENEGTYAACRIHLQYDITPVHHLDIFYVVVNCYFLSVYSVCSVLA